LLLKSITFSQLLKEIAVEYKIKIINNEQIKIQPKSSIAYVNIMKELKSRHTEIYIYKSKQEKSFKIVLKHIHATAYLDDIKKEIENLRYTVSNIWNIKKQSKRKVFSMFYVLKPESNKDIYQIGSLF